MQLKSAMTVSALMLALGGPALSSGCHEAAPPPRVEVPQRAGEGARFERDEVKPLPRQGRDRDAVQPAPFDDVPLVTQNTPEQKAYVRAYDDVGRPRIVVAVNRGVSPPQAQVPNKDAAGSGSEGGVGVRSIDTEAIENILTDWLAADGQVEIVSPLATAQPLTDQQKTDLRGGAPSAVAKDVGGDVLVQVSSRLTEQAGQDLQLRMVAEAVNIGDGRSIGRAVVDVPAPLDKPKINKYTRFMARKLMDGMILTWQSMGKQAPPPAAERSPAPSALPRIDGRVPEDATRATVERPVTPAPAPMPIPAPQDKPIPPAPPAPQAEKKPASPPDDTVVVPRE